MRFMTCYRREDYLTHYDSGHWRDETYVDLLVRAAERGGDREAISDARTRLSWRELQGCVESLATQLAARGIGGGDVVLAHLPNRVEFPILALACSWVEAAMAPLVAASGASEVLAVTERVNAVAYAGTSEVEASGEIMARLGEAGVTLLSPGGNSDIDLSPAALLAAPAPAMLPRRPSPDVIVDVMFTSGTTGLPKGIINTTNSKLSGLRGFLSETDLGPDDVWAVIPPMAHNAGWLYSYLPALATGARVALLERWRPADALRLLETERVTAAFLVPVHAVDLLEAHQRSPTELEGLRIVLIGAAETPSELKEAIVREFSATPVAMYGMTECQANVFTRPTDPLDLVLSSVGRPCPGMEVAIFAEDRVSRLPGGAVGEIATRGPGLFGGYFDDQNATSASFSKEGWFFSGDLGVMDAAGNVSIAGRIKDVIIRGGANILPEDIERAIEVCGGVAGVAVVGVPDPRLGEVVCACVVTTEGPLDRESLTESLAQRGVGRGLWPDIVLNVDSLPTTALGKIQRSKVRELAVARLSEGEAAAQ